MTELVVATSGLTKRYRGGALVLLAGTAGLVATIVWWERADQTG